jgi:hypothetical protein
MEKMLSMNPELTITKYKIFNNIESLTRKTKIICTLGLIIINSDQLLVM